MIILPWPPTINTYYAVVRGRKILSKRGRQFKVDAQYAMLEQKTKKLNGSSYFVRILAFPPDKRKRDIDNILKPILDALVNYGAIQDDSMVDDLRIQRFEILKGGQIKVIFGATAWSEEPISSQDDLCRCPDLYRTA